MGNSDLQKFPSESLQLRIPPSPKLSGSMSQSKSMPGSPKSPKSPDDVSKSDGTISSPSKLGRSSSSTKLSPGNSKSLSLAERLAQSTRGKSFNPGLRSPVSKLSPPSPPTILNSSKSDVSKESTDQCIKSDEVEVNKVNNDSAEIKVEITEQPNESHEVLFENGISELSEVDDIMLNQAELKENILVEVKENETAKCDINEVDIFESLDNSMKSLRIDDSVILEQTTKKDVRQKIWEFMEENSLVVFPKPCFNRIPNFKGCITASNLLEKLEEFKKAKTIQVTPDKAQETARFLTLTWGKRLLVPLLRLKEGLLQNVSLPFPEPSIKMLRAASTQKGLRKWGNKLITLDQNNDGHHIDMIILGSVAVDKKGHRIGIGNGYCDLEFVILSLMNMVTDNTVVVTIVHDVQVFDSLSTDIFKPYDVPVDIIITPTEVIRVETRLDRPKNVFWNHISKRRLLEMPPLQLLRTKQEKDSDYDCTLKDVDSEPEEIPPSPRTLKKSKGYHYHRRAYSTVSETNDSVFKDNEVVKRSTSKHSLVSASKTNIKPKHKRAKSTLSQQNRSSSIGRRNNQNDHKERSFSKKPNKRRTKSESAKTVESPVTINESKNSNGIQAVDSPSVDTPKSKRRSRQKQKIRDRVHSEDKQSVHQSTSKLNDNNKYSSRSNSRVTRRDYVDHQDREMSVGRNTHREYNITSPIFYKKNRQNSYSQERPSYDGIRSSSRLQHRDSNRSVMQHNRYTNGPVVHQSRYFNGPMVRHNSYNGSASHQNGGNNNFVYRHNSYSNDSMTRQNNFYDGIISRRSSFSKGSTFRQDGYTSSRVFRPPQYRGGVASVTNERGYARESKSHFNNNRPTYFNEKPNYSKFLNSDEFILKVGNIANNVRVRDLKAALMERGVKPLHITWRGPRGFAYLRYINSTDVNKENVIGSLQNVRIKPNGVETAQTQTLIVTECQFS